MLVGLDSVVSCPVCQGSLERTTFAGVVVVVRDPRGGLRGLGPYDGVSGTLWGVYTRACEHKHE